MYFDKLLSLCPFWDKIRNKVSLYSLQELKACSKQALLDTDFLESTQLNQYFLFDVEDAIDRAVPNRNVLLSLFVINYHYYCTAKLKTVNNNHTDA